VRKELAATHSAVISAAVSLSPLPLSSLSSDGKKKDKDGKKGKKAEGDQADGGAAAVDKDLFWPLHALKIWNAYEKR
jgi:hypothetical protein